MQGHRCRQPRLCHAGNATPPQSSAYLHFGKGLTALGIWEKCAKHAWVRVSKAGKNILCDFFTSDSIFRLQRCLMRLFHQDSTNWHELYQLWYDSYCEPYPRRSLLRYRARSRAGTRMAQVACGRRAQGSWRGHQDSAIRLASGYATGQECGRRHLGSPHRLENRVARVLFVMEGSTMVLLHGFIKKSQTTSKADLDLAKDRLKQLDRR